MCVASEYVWSTLLFLVVESSYQVRMCYVEYESWRFVHTNASFSFYKLIGAVTALLTPAPGVPFSPFMPDSPCNKTQKHDIVT